MGLGIGIKTRVRRNRVRGGFVGLLDQPFASGATAAYSLRLLRAKHSGGLIRSRADDAGTDKGEADVLPLLQPDGSKIVELNSPIENLNIKAQNRLGTNQGGGDKVLADLVDAGNSNFDGFVPNWYEQSPNQNDASQGAASAQPKIVNSGSIVRENNKPALQFDGAGDGLVSDYGLNETDHSYHIHVIFKIINLQDPGVILQGGRSFIIDRGSSSLITNIGGSDLGGSKGTSDQVLITVHWNKNNGELEIFKNGTLDGSTTTTADRTASQTGIGNNQTLNAGSNANIQEILIYENNDFSNRTKIENEIKGTYNKLTI